MAPDPTCGTGFASSAVSTHFPPAGAAQAPFKATPKARRPAREVQLDLSRIGGTGPEGRIVAEDVERAAARSAPHEQRPIPGAGAAPVLPAPGAQVSWSEGKNAAAPIHQVRASPVARRLAEAAGLDLAAIKSAGREGRIMRQDVEAVLPSQVPPPVHAKASAEPIAGADSAASTSEPQVCATMPLSGVRGVIARRMAHSAHTAAAVTHVTQVDATELVRLRRALSEEWAAEHGFGPSYNDLLLLMLARALGEFPYMNAHLAGDEIHHMADINVGLAVDSDRGLVVPVVKGLAYLSLPDLARATRDLVARAQAGRLLPDDLAGGTFTLSNLGVFDVDAFTPILNLPECAILGVGRIVDRPAVVREGDAEGAKEAIRIRPTMTLSLTFDHRAIDGAPAARFLQRLRQLIEEPYRLF